MNKNKLKGQAKSLIKPEFLLSSLVLLIVIFYQFNIIFVIFDLQLLALISVISIWSFLFMYKHNLSGKTFTRFSIYLLIFTFFVFYQLYFLNQRGIVFAATPIPQEPQ